MFEKVTSVVDFDDLELDFTEDDLRAIDEELLGPDWEDWGADLDDSSGAQSTGDRDTDAT